MKIFHEIWPKFWIQKFLKKEDLKFYLREYCKYIYINTFSDNQGRAIYVVPLKTENNDIWNAWILFSLPPISSNELQKYNLYRYRDWSKLIEWEKQSVKNRTRHILKAQILYLLTEGLRKKGRSRIPKF